MKSRQRGVAPVCYRDAMKRKMSKRREPEESGERVGDGEVTEKPIVFEGDGGVRVLMLVGNDLAQLVREAASGGTGRIYAASGYTDVLAIGCDLAVVDPTILAEREWNCLCEVYSAYVDVEFRILLIRPSHYEKAFPERNAIQAPVALSVAFVRGVMLRAAARCARKAACEKRERQIVRLMHMLRRLDSGGLRIRDVAAHFEVSVRTIQRDLEVLAMAGYPIRDGAESGTYVFPKGVRSINMSDE